MSKKYQKETFEEEEFMWEGECQTNTFIFESGKPSIKKHFFDKCQMSKVFDNIIKWSSRVLTSS